MADFKAIVIGGGPVGLIVAHALQAVGIDYVLVEKRPTIPPPTSFALFLWPQCVRIFHQLGLLEAMEKIAKPMEANVHLSPSGEIIKVDKNFDLLCFMHGYPIMLFDRGSFGAALEQGLRDRDRHVRVGAKLVNIVQTADGVTAEFADGTSEKGSIVIGADGVWSATRSLIRTQAPKGLFEDLPYSASFRGMFGKAPLPGGLAPNTLYHVHGGKTDLQIFTTETEGHFVTYERMATVSERSHFGPGTVDDKDGAAASWLGTKLADTVTFGDLWKKRVAAGHVNYDEGMSRAWHWNRVVLVGDAAHKMLPNQGTGANVGIEGAISLVNQLASLLRRNPRPGRRDVSGAFEAYQAEREGLTARYLNLARFHLDLSINDEGPRFKALPFADRQVPPMVAEGVILKSVPFPDEKQGAIPWKVKVRAGAETGKSRARL